MSRNSRAVWTIRLTVQDVNTDSLAAQQIGTDVTSAFLTNYQFVNGAQPLEVFTQIIDSMLATSETE